MIASPESKRGSSLASDPPVRQPAVIIVADRDDAVRTGLEFFLTWQFPKTQLIFFDDPNAAASRLLESPADLLITDLVTPKDEHPEQIIRALHTLQDALAVILITAATPDRVGTFVASAGSCKIVYLPKPFSAGGLLTALNKCFPVCGRPEPALKQKDGSAVRAAKLSHLSIVLRWLAVLPAALGGYVLAILCGAFVVPYVGFWAQEVIPEGLWEAFQAAITGILAGGSFVSLGISLAPSHRFLLACVLIVLQALVTAAVLWAMHFTWNRGSGTPVTFLVCSIFSSVLMCKGWWRNGPAAHTGHSHP